MSPPPQPIRKPNPPPTMANSSNSTPYTKFEILPNIYLSRFPKEIPEEITHVLNMCTMPHPPDGSRIYLHIPIDDIDDITPHIASIIAFIENARPSNGKVIVHCALGINRSVAAVVAYVCHAKGMCWGQALRLIREKKGDVKPSALFLRQIDRWFKKERGEGEDVGSEGDEEDPLMGFHRRLQARKRALKRDEGNEKG
jgi:protein-tyrosine phosphatase